MNTLTPGALRAAKKIIHELMLRQRPFEESHDLGLGLVDIAKMIDAATALPELSEACCFALFTIEHRDGLRYREDLFTTDERNKLRNAITLTEKGEA
jgi:hypothetical protein